MTGLYGHRLSKKLKAVTLALGSLPNMLMGHGLKLGLTRGTHRSNRSTAR